jgi:hypothetical protein
MAASPYLACLGSVNQLVGLYSNNTFLIVCVASLLAVQLQDVAASGRFTVRHTHISQLSSHAMFRSGASEGQHRPILVGWQQKRRRDVIVAAVASLYTLYELTGFGIIHPKPCLEMSHLFHGVDELLPGMLQAHMVQMSSRPSHLAQKFRMLEYYSSCHTK